MIFAYVSVHLTIKIPLLLCQKSLLGETVLRHRSKIFFQEPQLGSPKPDFRIFIFTEKKPVHNQPSCYWRWKWDWWHAGLFSVQPQAQTCPKGKSEVFPCECFCLWYYWGFQQVSLYWQSVSAEIQIKIIISIGIINIFCSSIRQLFNSSGHQTNQDKNKVIFSWHWLLTFCTEGKI